MTPSHPEASATPGGEGTFSRRSFLRSSAIVGAAAGADAATKPWPFYRPAINPAWTPRKPERDLQIAIVGCGEQGNALMTAIERIQDAKMVPHIRAVVDVDRTKLSELAGRATAGGHQATQYANMDLLLEKEGKELDAVILAVPDWIHHELTIKGLQAGLHVYCEKMMSNRIDWAREMVKAQLASGKLLQIGHQRRSSPRYLALRNGIIGKHLGLGRMTHAYAQWHRGIQSSTPLEVRGSKQREELSKQLGYGSFHEFRNWRHYRKYGGGIISDLGAHQIDLFNWFFQALPKRLVAMGGVDYWTPDNPRGHYELPDNVMVMYEYDVPAHLSPDGKVHTARAYYQTLTTTGSQSFHEKFYGDCATVTMSEVPKWNDISQETFLEAPVTAEDVASAKSDSQKDYNKLVHEYQQRWETMKNEGLIYAIPSDRVWKGRRPWESPKPFGRQPPTWFKTPKEEDEARRTGYVDARVSREPAVFGLGTVLNVPPHQPHLLNFFAAVEAGKKEMLNCPGEEAFHTCVSVLKIYEALENGGTYEFKPEDFAI